MLDLFGKYEKDNPEFFWVFVILAGMFALWVMTGGPERSEQERNNKFIEPLQPLGGGQTYDEPVFDPEGPVIQYPYIRQD